MRFVLSIACKYLIPRWRQLSVSVISLISILVITLVVWLVIVFLSVTAGIEKNWINQLVALNAPVRILPTDDYYHSYYYQIDNISANSHYSTKTLGEKLLTSIPDSYDPMVDSEIPADFPAPDLNADGSLKDLTKEAWDAIHSLDHSAFARASEFEVSFGNLRLSLLRDDSVTGEPTQTYLTQVSYVTTFDPANTRFQKLLMSPTVDDLNNILKALSFSNLNEHKEVETSLIEKTRDLTGSQLSAFFDAVDIKVLKASEQGFRLPRSLFPTHTELLGCGLVKNGKIAKVIIPSSVQHLTALQQTFSSFGHQVLLGVVKFGDGRPVFIPDIQEPLVEVSRRLEFLLEPGIQFNASLLQDSVKKATSLSSLQFDVSTLVQGHSLSGTVRFEQLEIAEASAKHTTSNGDPLWIHHNEKGELTIPTDRPLGDGMLLAKTFRDSGVRLGDTGFLSYYSQTPSGMQEQRLPIYVAGFYDPGFMPVGNKIILVDPKVVALLRGNVTVADRMLGNGFHVWTTRVEDAKKIQTELRKSLAKRNIDRYWTVETFYDYDFAKPVLQQLQSDKTLFTLIAVIILVVACSNIISMLILLVNDKKREIGIMQSLGASSTRIASIFGICGFITGLISSVLGIIAAFLTLSHIKGLVNLLSFLQGNPVFQSAFYGENLPNELNMEALLFVVVATTLISLLAGIAPAIKAARIRPTEILRSE